MIRIYDSAVKSVAKLEIVNDDNNNVTKTRKDSTTSTNSRKYHSVKTCMISITSTNPEFSVNFPSPIPVKEIALAKLRAYHSWPNIRSVAFGG